jgi:hypothetical protein
VAAWTCQLQSITAYRSDWHDLVAGLLLLLNSPFLFGYAKPVPV